MRNILKLYVANLAKIFLELLPAILSWSEKVESVYSNLGIELMPKFSFCKIQADFWRKGRLSLMRIFANIKIKQSQTSSLQYVWR